MKDSSSTLLHKHLLVVQNNVRPPNLIRWNPYEFNPIILNRSPSQFVVVPHLKQPQNQAPSANIVASLMASHKGQKLLTCLSHRLVSIIWFTSSWRDKKGDLLSKRRGNNEWMSDVISALALSRSKIKLIPLPLWPVEIWRPQTPLWLGQRHFPPVGWIGCTSWTTSGIIGPPPLMKNSLMKGKNKRLKNALWTAQTYMTHVKKHVAFELSSISNWEVCVDHFPETMKAHGIYFSVHLHCFQDVPGKLCRFHWVFHWIQVNDPELFSLSLFALNEVKAAQRSRCFFDFRGKKKAGSFEKNPKYKRAMYCWPEGGSVCAHFKAGLKVILWKTATSNTGASDGTEIHVCPSRKCCLTWESSTHSHQHNLRNQWAPNPFNITAE